MLFPGRQSQNGVKLQDTQLLSENCLLTRRVRREAVCVTVKDKDRKKKKKTQFLQYRAFVCSGFMGCGFI